MTDAERERLRQQQVALAQRLTQTIGQPADSNLRTTFGLECNDELRCNDLLSNLDPSELQRSAETLSRKRRSQTASLLPITVRILGERYHEYFDRFAPTHFPQGQDAIWQDAICFGLWLRTQTNDPVWLHDALRWEMERCRWESRRWFVTLFRMRYAVHQVLEQRRSEEPDRAPRYVWMCRFGTRGWIRFFSR